MCKLAILRCLQDAQISYNQVNQVYVGYVYGDSCAGQRSIYEIGMTGVPIINVNNNCSTGSTALYMGYQAIKSGQATCVLCLGFDKMNNGSLQKIFNDRTYPLDRILDKQENLKNKNGKLVQGAPQIFGNAALEYMQKNPMCNSSHLDKIAKKNHLHSIHNSYALNKNAYSEEQIKNSPQIYGPMTLLHCCSNSDGAAAILLCSEEFMFKHKLIDQAVEILGCQLQTDKQDGLNNHMNMAGYQMTKATAEECYKEVQRKTGLKSIQAVVDMIKVVELHDCFSASELISYEALQLCPENQAHNYIDKAQFTYGGKCVVNPSGGLISKGHPLGATGIAQCNELCWQLRNMARARQVQQAKQGFALQHNLGLGGACVVTIYKKYNQSTNGDQKPFQTQELRELQQIERNLNITAKL